MFRRLQNTFFERRFMRELKYFGKFAIDSDVASLWIFFDKTFSGYDFQNKETYERNIKIKKYKIL